MFTDILTVDRARTSIIIHIFDPMLNNYAQKISFKVDGCSMITNAAIGRGEETLRLFVTC
jgi:hypothetical protein